MSSFYSEFPLVRYTLNEKENLFVNITRETSYNKDFFNNKRAFIEYKVQDSDTPITIADKLYDDHNLDWVVLHFNNIIDFNNEWVLNYYEFMEYINEKYQDINGFHHYESKSTGAVVYDGHDSFDITIISNFKYEERINENKRNLKLIHPDYVNQYVDLFNETIRVE